MAELPTEEELEKLYHEKGHDALVWYAWRNALRSLAMLGCSPFPEKWSKQNQVHILYKICRVSLVLAQWINSSTSSIAESLQEGIMVPDLSHNTAPHVALFSAMCAFTGDIEDTGNNSHISEAKVVARYAMLTTFAFTQCFKLEESRCISNFEDITEAVVNAAVIDYLFLNQQRGKLDELNWHSALSLWPHPKPKQILEWEEILLGYFHQLQLDFLADDLRRLWGGRDLGEHAHNYVKTLSQAITGDSELLRRAIFFGETTESVYSVRVLLLGAGGAGKSSLVDRLWDKPVEQVKPATLGVRYVQDQPLILHDTFFEFDLDEQEPELYLWDFGGQTIFHGLHSAFLHENCVYVLVVDSRHEQAPDEWLHQIRHLAGSQAKVLLVTNWYEQCETHQNKTRLRREFPDLLTADSFFYFSCHNKDAPDFKRFVQSLVKASLNSQKMVLKETLDVQRALDEKYKDDDTVFVRESKLRDLIATVSQHPESTDSTLNQLQQLGFLVRVEKGNSRYCLKPAWAVDNAYQLLYSPILRQANGILNLTALEQVFAGKVDEDHVEYLVSFLNERSLCIRLQDNGKYFFPDATRADEPLSVSELLNQQNKLTLRFDVPYLPLGFHARLVHKLFVPHSEVGIHDPQDIWRQGFILRAGITSQAVVHYLLRKNVIEMVLTGDLKAFSALLREFYTHLKAVLVSPNGIRPEQIHPSVLFNQQSFSVHSGEGLVKVLAQIDSYDQLFQEIRNMASTVHNEYHERVYNTEVTGDGQNAIGSENITMNQFIDKSNIQVTADQRQIISSVLDEMLRHKANLSDDVLEAVYDVRKEVKADEKQPTEKSQSVLGRLWGGIRELTNVAKDMTDVGGFVVEHQAAIGTAVTAAAALLS
ncbi:COR domain-containing protein [Thiothrix subterranea]|uniref:COR domain-containing protein n=1 Tax=Thiothrix subterranea TaxID=2735563 RepID=A0AA51MPI5_9GAMM|nr:COR domain-containing protein [Thiothrix subterranea]MDQ5770005.1 COR domain-containing protein [Thiothrix subterranea]WML88294.1 COR domain-containing protein [Thiothrix subterranea]